MTDDLLGSIEPLPSGRFRYRVTVRRVISRTTCDTLAEAQTLQLAVSSRSRTPNAKTLKSFGAEFLDWRETVKKARGIVTDRSRWRVHVEPSPMARIPLRELKQSDIEKWVDRLSGSGRTKRNTLNLVRVALGRAKRERLIQQNPAIGVHIDEPDESAWTYLSASDQSTLMSSEVIPWADRVAISFAIGTGVRQGEQWALELRDLHLDDDDPHAIIRWGSRAKPTKTGRVRRVPILPWLVPIMQAWVRALPAFLMSPSGKKAYANEHGLVFPTARGCYRRAKKPPRGWDRWLTRLEIRGVTGHQVVWHSLRHTCASMLVSGAWGRRWTLQEVAELLGHASVTTTERYAHLAEGTIARAARETMPRSCHAIVQSSRATVDSNHWPSVPETCENHEWIRGLEPSVASDVARLAAAYLEAVADADKRHVAIGCRLAEAVLASFESDGMSAISRVR